MSNQICDIINSTEFAEERLVASAQSLLEEILQEKGWNQNDLAAAMGVTKSRVSQVFSSNQNFTLRFLAKAFHAVGDEVCLERTSRKTYYKSSHIPIDCLEQRTAEDILTGFDWIENNVQFGEQSIESSFRRSVDLDEVFAKHLRNFSKSVVDDADDEEIFDQQENSAEWGSNVISLRAGRRP